MPKISAATVAEHRAQQRTALLEAARELLLHGGYTALNFTALAEHTGLARPTIYSYFRTKDDLAVALCEAELPVFAAETAQAVRQAADTPRDQIAAFIRAQIDLSHQGRYRLARTLIEAPLSVQARERSRVLHRELMPSAIPLLTALGHPHPALAAALLQGLINAAVIAVDAGEPADRVTDLAISTALNGFG